MAGNVTLRLVLATGLLQPLYKFSSLARRTHKAEKNEDLLFFFFPPSCKKDTHCLGFVYSKSRQVFCWSIDPSHTHRALAVSSASLCVWRAG